MSEQQMQFRVGLLAIVAFGLAAVMAVKFGDLAALLKERYPLAVHFDHAPGVYPGTPVSKNGIVIGEVAAVRFDEQRGGVLVALSIEPQYRLRKNAEPHLSRSLLGDSGIEFVPGAGPGFIEPGARLEGVAPVDPMKLVVDLGGRLDRTLAGFDATAAQWAEVGRNVNGVLGDNREEMNLALARASVALEETALSMRSLRQTADHAAKLVGDPTLQRNLNRTAAALPPLLEETRQTIVATRSAVGKADAALANVEGFTRPLAEKGVSVATRLDVTLANFEQVSADLADLSTLLKREDGSLTQLASDPSLYRNLDASAEHLNVLLANLAPVLRDLRVFSDKIARNPELIGVRGALRGSDGQKTVR
ncbi:MlaD family protein [Alienimonas sp. DA493]|uniref:MlaD family protein n=1 Tax=Alienimonas sp. DA493 TaxID=3373605 RepID=UPI003754EA30